VPAFAPREAEAVASSWLAARGLGPQPAEPPESIDDGATALADALWFTAPSGWAGDAPQNQVQGAALLTGLGRAVRRLHDLEPDASLARCTIEDLLEEATRRVRDEQVDPAAFAPARRHLPPASVLEGVRALASIVAGRRPVAPVVTHGACRFGAVWLDGAEPTGFIANARLAVADPYRDLGAMARSLATTFGPEALPGFFAAYGVVDPDPIRLEFHALLDELL